MSWTEEKRKAHSEKLKKIWANKTPEQRERIRQKQIAYQKRLQIEWEEKYERSEEISDEIKDLRTYQRAQKYIKDNKIKDIEEHIKKLEKEQKAIWQ